MFPDKDSESWLYITWNSAVLGLEIWAALVPEIFFPSLSAISSWEHYREWGGTSLSCIKMFQKTKTVFVCAICCFLTRAKVRASVNPAAARSCLNSSVSLFSGNWKRTWKRNLGGNATLSGSGQHGSESTHLVSYGVRVRHGVGDVVETVSDSSVLHDVAGVDDVWTGGRDLNLDLIVDASCLGEQAHPGEQLSYRLSRLTIRKTNKHPASVKCGNWNFAVVALNKKHFYRTNMSSVTRALLRSAVVKKALEMGWGAPSSGGVSCRAAAPSHQNEYGEVVQETD